MKSVNIKILNFILCITIIITVLLGLKVGFVDISFYDVYCVILNKIFSVNLNDLNGKTLDIIIDLRFPRIFLALSIGMALTLSGVVMQAILKNPLADPYILGVSSGASLGATAAIFFGLGSIFGSQVVGIAACFGAFAVSMLVAIISGINKESNSTKLLLGGVVLGTICSGISGMIVYFGKNKEGMEAITYWMMGNVANAKIESVCILFIIVIIALMFFYTQPRILNMMLFGEEQAIILGVDLHKYIIRYLFINGLLVGFAVLNAGTIGFIGLIVPHFIRALVGANHKKMLLTTVLFGGLVTVVMDIVSRIAIKGVDIPLGIIFAFLGAPLFVYLILKSSYKMGDSE